MNGATLVKLVDKRLDTCAIGHRYDVTSLRQDVTDPRDNVTNHNADGDATDGMSDATKEL